MSVLRDRQIRRYLTAFLALAGAALGAGVLLAVPSRLSGGLLLSLLAVCLAALFGGTAAFLCRRARMYRQAAEIIRQYMDGDFSRHLPQNQEGEMYQLFSQVEQLATMLQAKGEAERRTKEFLKATISDISHQLKTPLSAMMMYQEILAGEPEDPETVAAFAEKMGLSLCRMEQLIQAMLKIARLDSGSILFERRVTPVTDLVDLALRDLRTRAEREGKTIWTEGDAGACLLCDPAWTAEALGNLVKNALDHTETGGRIRLSWTLTPGMLQIQVADNGSGIAPEDLHHIFKRFYRSRHTLDTPGVGLGLPLARSIVEGQGGVITVESPPGEGAVFTAAFLTKL